ncbi:hypothetical protein ElyMa_003986500 [Elysia marginata]|uniref:Myb-like domain-containing protein n=1 Tax=Elysia marginata TaxID=1093978 RepID=A0AAV4FZD8_9GAST|nr:hypothetical protein ElyMa_003986500 [Elysia marginata]
MLLHGPLGPHYECDLRETRQVYRQVPDPRCGGPRPDEHRDGPSSSRLSKGTMELCLPPLHPQMSTRNASTQKPVGFLPGGSDNPAYLSLLLLMAGDVERNAGPSDLCSVCGKIVAAGRVVPQCSSCLHWVHARCSALTYQRIRRLEPDHNWYRVIKTERTTARNIRGEILGGGILTAISLCSVHLAPKISWFVYQNALGSDHFPIVIEVETSSHIATPRPRKQLAFKKSDWAAYELELTKSLNENQTTISESKSTDKANSILTKLILNAAHKAIPTGCSGNKKTRWNDEVDAAVKERTQPWANANKSEGDRKSWLAKCAELKKLIIEAKHKTWREFAGGLNARTDPCKVWKTIKAIDGRGKRAPEGAALNINGKLITSSQKKADNFARMYRDVSEVRNKKLDDQESTKLGIPRNRDRNLLRSIRKFSSSKCNCAENGLCSEFTARELSAAINALSNTSPGDDEVHNQLLQHLPEIGKQSLLQLYNRLKNSGQYPAAWRKGTIIPILKAGKDPSQMGSYRPIQLTSCEDLRLVYLTYIRSDISYAYNAWYPCVSKENREKLEVTQRDAVRAITGCTKNTNSKLLINEAGLLPLYVESDIAQATAYERCLRLPGDEPLREIAENPVRRRLKSL